jgi:hypothetical protein
MDQEGPTDRSDTTNIRLDPGGGSFILIMPDQIAVAKLVPNWFGATFTGLSLIFGLTGAMVLIIGIHLLSFSNYLIIVGFLFFGFALTAFCYEIVSRAIKRKRINSSTIDELTSAKNDVEILQWSDALNVKFLSTKKIRITFRSKERKRFPRLSMNCRFDETSYSDLKLLFISKLGDRFQD